MVPTRSEPPRIGDPLGTAADLFRARELLFAPSAGAPKRGVALRSALSELCELWLTEHTRRIGMPTGGVALLALGALGRRDMLPYSDLDLVLLHEPGLEVTGLAEQLWYPLWDAGFGVDHSVRTPRGALAVADDDLRVALGLLEARPIAGDHALAVELIAGARTRWRGRLPKRFEELAEAAARRWSSTGDIAQRAEPDLKSGRGGVRDVHLLMALAAAQVIDRPDGRIRAGLALLLDVRGELHRVACRARDQLRAQDGDEVASALRVGDRFDLARLLSQTGRQVSYAVDVALRSVRSTLSPRRGVRTAPQRRPLADGVVLHSTGVSEVVLARSARVGGDPALVLRVAAAAARTATPISAGTLATLAKNASKPLNPWPDAMRGELIALLAAGPGLIEVVQALDATGLWGRLFPEWVAVADLPARDAAHIWTVDRHLLQTTVVAARMVTSVSRPDLLLLGALLHDIGKGRADDHSVLGARIVEQVGLRLGYSEPDVRLLRRLVRHHLLLPHTATRRDIGDPLTVSRVVEELNGDPVLLELLHYLTMADSQATGPGVWTEWRAALLDELVSSVRARISGVDDPLPSRIGEAATTLAQRAATTRRPELTVEGPERNAIVRIAATEQPGLLSVAAGVLVLGGVDVHSASLHRYRDISVGEFTVSPRFGALPDAAMLREQFRLALGGAVALAERIAAKERDYPPGAQGIAEPRVRWFDNESSAAPVLELRAVDRIGLLYRVAATLEHLAITVVWARVSTLGGTAIDSFCVLDGDPAAADPLRRKRITDAVLAAVR